MTSPKPRKGNNHVRATGRAVHVPDHTYTPSQRGRARSVTVPSASSLSQMALESHRAFQPSAEVTKRFQLGEPVETKPDWLDTEIGRVDFTEDLVVGFQSVAPALTKRDAWKIVTEAADRYARLTAFIAAEQGITCEELCALPDLWSGPVKKHSVHPRRVMEAVKRMPLRESDNENDAAEQVVYTLDGSFDEDEEILLMAARGYYTYLRFNAKLFTRNQNFNGEYTLESAMNIASGLNLTEGPGGGNYSLHDKRRTTFDNGKTSPDIILNQLSPEALALIETSTKRPDGMKFIEKHPAGLRINVSERERVEIIARKGPYTNNNGTKNVNGYIRRVVSENGHDYYLSSEGLPMNLATGMLDDYLLTAVDFSARPAPKGWIEYEMIGFEKRNALQRIKSKEGEKS